MIGPSEAKKLLTRQTVGGIVTGGEQCTITWEQARAIKELLEPPTECEIEHHWRNASDKEPEAFIDEFGQKTTCLHPEDLTGLRSAVSEYIRRKKGKLP
jgi:hypothetical protein